MNMYHSCKQMTKYCTANSQRYCHVHHWTNLKKGIHVCCYMYQRKLNWYWSLYTLVTNDEDYITTEVCHFLKVRIIFSERFCLSDESIVLCLSDFILGISASPIKSTALNTVLCSRFYVSMNAKKFVVFISRNKKNLI